MWGEYSRWLQWLRQVRCGLSWMPICLRRTVPVSVAERCWRGTAELCFTTGHSEKVFQAAIGPNKTGRHYCHRCVVTNTHHPFFQRYWETGRQGDRDHCSKQYPQIPPHLFLTVEDYLLTKHTVLPITYIVNPSFQIGTIVK